MLFAGYYLHKACVIIQPNARDKYLYKKEIFSFQYEFKWRRSESGDGNCSKWFRKQIKKP